MKATGQPHGARPRSVWLTSLIGLAFLVASSGARGQVPGEMNFQGLLLDAAGQPKNGSVTLVFELFAGPTGGTALWTETHASVPVTDGIYDVALGSTTPLTPADFSSATRYLEISVDGEVLAPRRQLLVVPYAIRSETANTANSAASATSALNVGGVSAEFVAQLYQYSDSDGNGIVNSDPTEGLADVDGDGAANFIDADNDGDGVSDADEVSQGSNPNAPTPTVAAFSPPYLLEATAGIVTVTGTNFDEPGLGVVFGSQTPTPTSVTPTSFMVDVGPQPGGVVSVVVSLANGEVAHGSFSFGRRVKAFVTSATYDGNLGGLTGADQKCQARADAAGLPGSYRAWLDATGDTSRTSNQWPTGSVFELVTGAEFAGSYSFLVTNPWHTPRLALDETGLARSGYAWAGGGCSNWSSNSASSSGNRGALQGFEDWENAYQSSSCAELLPLYCFQQ